jgi:hypothetical protein
MILMRCNGNYSCAGELERYKILEDRWRSFRRVIIMYKLQIKRGTTAELSSCRVLKAGELGFCTDSKEVYISDGMSNSVVGRALSGPEASRQ